VTSTHQAGQAARPTICLSVLDEFRSRFFDADAMRRLEAAGDLVLDPDPEEHASAESRASLARADVLLTCWDTGHIGGLLEAGALPRLRMLVHAGGSVRGITGPEIFDRGIRVSSQTELNSEPVAEFTMAMIILAAKNVFRAQHVYRQTKAKPPYDEEPFASSGFYGSTIGLIGLSRISRRVIDLLRTSPVTIKVSSGHLTEDEANSLGVHRATQDEVLSTCDVVSLHSASTPHTYHMLGAREFALLKDDATFINTARGAICDEQALIAELETGRIQAIIDVTDPEVPVPDSPLWTLPNVQLFPHYAGSMGRELYRLGTGAIDDVEHFLRGIPIAGEFTRREYDGRA
jgi:phosphoglycerate dehydrogenase-like enzyme